MGGPLSERVDDALTAYVDSVFSRDLVSKAVGVLIATHGQLVYSTILRACRGDRTISDEVFQDTFARFLVWVRRRGELPSREDLPPLLITFARRAAVDALREEQPHRRTVSLDAAQTVAIEPSPATSAIDRMDFAKLIASLDLRSRQVMELSILEGLSSGEIGQRLGLTPENVRVLRHRAVAIMRRYMRETEAPPKIEEGL